MTAEPTRSAPPVLVTLTRGGIVESAHRGCACVADARGNVLFSLGDPEFVTFLRSSAKPFQAAAVILSGAADAYALGDREIALLAGSHGGEEIHTSVVQAMLARAGLDPSALQCGVHPPLDADAKLALDRSGEPPSSLHHNCSSKHTGMLLTARHLGLPTGNYLDPGHPIQRRITEVIGEAAGVEPDAIVIGIDGCSAPVHGISARGIATMFARLVAPEGVSSELADALLRVSRSMREYPEMVAASKGRTCTELMKTGRERSVTGKAGAEGVYGAGWIDAAGRGYGLAVKMEDGMQRGRDPVVVALLQQFGALPKELPELMQPFAAGPIRNWRGLAVGEIATQW